MQIYTKSLDNKSPEKQYIFQGFLSLKKRLISFSSISFYQFQQPELV
jgi:hypothetical protein